MGGSGFATPAGLPKVPPPIPEGASPILSPTQLAGEYFATLGRTAKNVVAAGYFFRQLREPELAEEQMHTPPGEPTPIEQGEMGLPTPLQVMSEAAWFGGVSAAVGGSSGIAGRRGASAAAATAMFGTTPEGFDPAQAAVAAVLPWVGKYSGAIIGKIADKFGVSSTKAYAAWKAAGAMTGAAGYLAAIDESKIRTLPPEQRDAARIDMVAGLIGQSVLGPMGVEKTKTPHLAEVLDDITAHEPVQGPVQHSDGESLHRVSAEGPRTDSAARHGRDSTAGLGASGHGIQPSVWQRPPREAPRSTNRRKCQPRLSSRSET